MCQVLSPLPTTVHWNFAGPISQAIKARSHVSLVLSLLLSSWTPANSIIADLFCKASENC